VGHLLYGSFESFHSFWREIDTEVGSLALSSNEMNETDSSIPTAAVLVAKL
jgi:hypothetical protein